MCILLFNISKGIDSINKSQIFTFRALQGWMTSVLDILYKDVDKEMPVVDDQNIEDVNKAYEEGEILLDKLIEKSKNLEDESGK